MFHSHYFSNYKRLFDKREKYNDERTALPSKNKDIIPNSVSKTRTLVSSNNSLIDQKLLEDEWCQARDYEDLSNDPIFTEFNRWLSDFNKVTCLLDDNCSKHDPRKILKFQKIGEKIALERRKVFEKIIRGDPQQAIHMALPEETINKLPDSIALNIERWKSEKINLDSIHVCYDPNHPEGLIKHWAIMEDGKKYRVWTHGNEENADSQRCGNLGH